MVGGGVDAYVLCVRALTAAAYVIVAVVGSQLVAVIVRVLSAAR